MKLNKLKYIIKKQFICSKCDQLLQQNELITVINPKWKLNPIDKECCPICNGLAIEVSDD